MMQQYDKMILAILQGDDYHDAVHSLNEHGFYATVLNSSGGFLKKRSVTLMIGLESARLDEALAILKKLSLFQVAVIIVLPSSRSR